MNTHLSIDYLSIGQRLRAYRIGASLRAEDVAKHLNISRAAVYRLEQGGLVKIDVLEKLSQLLDVSISSLLGVEVEYYATAHGFFERLRQLEHNATKIKAHFDPFSFLLTSPDYLDALETMLLESSDNEQPNSERIQQTLTILAERKKAYSQQKEKAQIYSLIGIPQIEKFLHLGLIGNLNIQPSKKFERVLSARKEIVCLIEQLEEQNNLNQVAVVNQALPNQTFQIMYKNRTPFSLTMSPFRLGELPNIDIGIASVTSTPEAIKLYEDVFDKLWERGAKGAKGIDALKTLLDKY